MLRAGGLALRSFGLKTFAGDGLLVIFLGFNFSFVSLLVILLGLILVNLLVIFVGLILVDRCREFFVVGKFLFVDEAFLAMIFW